MSGSDVIEARTNPCFCASSSGEVVNTGGNVKAVETEGLGVDLAIVGTYLNTQAVEVGFVGDTVDAQAGRETLHAGLQSILRLGQIGLANHGSDVSVDHGHVKFLPVLRAPLTGPLSCFVRPSIWGLPQRQPAERL